MTLVHHKFQAVDGLTLPEEIRSLLRPDEEVALPNKLWGRLPRYFYAVANREEGNKLLTPNFALAELMIVDCRESRILFERWPRYVPCAIMLLTAFLQAFRDKIGLPVYVAANGGYRSPSHQINKCLGAHSWAIAADIYRVGDTYLTDKYQIEKYGSLAQSTGFHLKSSRPEVDEASDHLHVELEILSAMPSDGIA